VPDPEKEKDAARQSGSAIDQLAYCFSSEFARTLSARVKFE
jgi:hypothetical protein